MDTPDLSNVPAEDLQHIANGDMGKVSEPVLRHLAGQPQAGPVSMSAPSGLAGPAGDIIKGAFSPLDAIASGVSHVASGTLAPPLALAARGIAALRGKDPNAASQAVHDFATGPGTYHARTPGGQAAEADTGAVLGKIAAPFGSAANALESAAGPEAAQHIENVSGLGNDVAGSLPVAGAVADAVRVARTAGETTQVARGAADVAKEAGYTGLKSRADLKAPGSQAITDSLISQDNGLVQGATPNVASVQNARAVGPARVYNRLEAAMPPQLTQDPALQAGIKAVGDSASQLPRSPDVDALRSTMLNQPDMTSTELFANIRAARSRSASLLASENPDNVALGHAYGQLADAYEGFAERNIPPNSGITAEQWQGARTQFAKSFLAEEALKGGEHFDPAVYGRAAQNAPGLLTGGGKVVADTYNALPTSHGDAIPRGIGAAAGGLLGAAAEHAVAGAAGAGGAGGAIVGSQVAPAVRDLFRRFSTRGNPEAAAGAAQNPRLSYVYGRNEPGPGGPPAMNLAPPPGAVGVQPRQLGMALAPGAPAAPGMDLAPPPGAVSEPLQRTLALALRDPNARLNFTKQLLQQLALRNEQLPGTLSAGGPNGE